MSTSPNPNPPAMVRKRRRRKNEATGWKAVPLAVKILIGLCLVIVIGIPVGKQNGWLKKREVEVTADKTAQEDLVLGESTYVAQTRTMKGTVVNKSRNTYTNVTVSFRMVDGRGTDLGSILGVVPKLGPNQKAAFETDPMPAGAAADPVPREISGTLQ